MAGQVPLVTIGIPVFNGERYLAEAVRSAIDQDYPDIRVVISDNASTDGTPMIAAEMVAVDARISYLRQAVNIGPNANYNLLVREANGTYFKWLAADDRCHRTFIRRCVEILEADASVMVCGSAREEIDEHGRPLGVRSEHLDLTGPSGPTRFGRLLCTDRGHGLIYGVIRLSTLRTTGLLADYYGSERALLAELALLGQVVELDDMLWSSREHRTRSTYLRFDTTWNPRLRRRSTLVYPAILRRMVSILLRSPATRRDRVEAGGRLLLCLVRRVHRLTLSLVGQVRRTVRTPPG
jgi:glycosyltransferase involved in cell wall biosynthesis